MPEQSKFENMDLFASLEAIMKQNTGFYQSDLDIDKEIIAKAAASPHREDKTLLWFCRPSGTHCFRERDVFLKDTAPHNTWRFYMEQTSDRVLAYAIELTGKERGKIKGNLYELDYSKHYERVKEKELPADTVKLIYEHGEREIPAGQFFNGNPDYELGKFERFEALPDDPDALQSLLQEERRSREQLPPGDFKAHITALRDGLIETEARRIVREMKRHYEPNSPNKTHFMAELSPAFMRLAATKDTDRLFSMLPYKTLSFSKIEGRHGTYALIDKGENRDSMKPNEMVNLQEGGFAEKRLVNTDEYTCWMQGMISLTGESVESVTQRLSHYYGVTILPDDKISVNKLYGKLILGNRVKEVLQTIETMTQTRMKVHGDTIYLVKK